MKFRKILSAVLALAAAAMAQPARAQGWNPPPPESRCPSQWGANAVGVGRPYLWGLGAFGEAGVAKVLEILRTETRVAMMQCGVRTVKEFTPAFVRKV